MPKVGNAILNLLLVKYFTISELLGSTKTDHPSLLYEASVLVLDIYIYLSIDI